MKRRIFRTSDAASGGGAGVDHKKQRLQKNLKWLKEGEENLAEAIKFEDISQEQHDAALADNKRWAEFIENQITSL